MHVHKSDISSVRHMVLVYSELNVHCQDRTHLIDTAKKHIIMFAMNWNEEKDKTVDILPFVSFKKRQNRIRVVYFLMSLN